MITKKNWAIAPAIPSDIKEELSDFSPLLQQLLYNRGIVSRAEAHTYIESYGSLYDPFLLSQMEEAVDRIHQALERGEQVTVYGDYDCDGITGTVLLYEFLKKIGADAAYYIPDRFEEGYGLNVGAVENLAQNGCKLMLTVDCGIRSIKEIARANDLGMDVILTDHHLPGDELPPAAAVIDHQKPGDPYPDKNLCGAGIAYKLVSAYLQRYPAPNTRADDWLDLVAVATVADIVPLVGENRSLVKAGLDVIHRGQRLGLAALIRAASMEPNQIKSSNIGFGIGPRLNAAGRIDSALNAVELLLSDDPHHAATLAQKLDDLNGERQDMTHHIQELAQEQALENDSPYLIFSTSPEFHMGVAGLAASRLTDTYYRPSIVGYRGEEETRASCRSIPEFHITNALDECADLFVRYGGHAAAAGFTVLNDNVAELTRRLSEIAERELGGRELIPTIPVDVPFNFTYLCRNSADVYHQVQLLEPTGTENPPVLFAARNLRVVNSYLIGKDRTHLRLKLSDGFTSESAIAFRQGYWHENMPEYIDILFTLEKNFYRNQLSYQIHVREIRPHQDN